MDRGALRDVALARFELVERGEPEPVAEPVEERGRARHRPGHGRTGKTNLLGRQWLDRKGGEDHVFDAEAGIDGVEPLFKESGEVVRVAAGASDSEDDPFDPTINAMEGEIESPRSHPFPRQTKDEILSEPLGREREIGGIGDRFGKAQPHAADRRFAERRQWLGQIIERLIETPRYRFTKPVSEGG